MNVYLNYVPLKGFNGITLKCDHKFTFPSQGSPVSSAKRPRISLGPRKVHFPENPVSDSVEIPRYVSTIVICYVVLSTFWGRKIPFQNLAGIVHCSPRAPEGKHTRKKLQLWHSTTEDLRRWARHWHTSMLKHIVTFCSN